VVKKYIRRGVTSNILLNWKLQSLSVDKKVLQEHRLAVHLLGCGICGEMFNTRGVAKSCFFSHFFSHFVDIDDWLATLRGTV